MSDPVFGDAVTYTVRECTLTTRTETVVSRIWKTTVYNISAIEAEIARLAAVGDPLTPLAFEWVKGCPRGSEARRHREPWLSAFFSVAADLEDPFEHYSNEAKAYGVDPHRGVMALQALINRFAYSTTETVETPVVAPAPEAPRPPERSAEPGSPAWDAEESSGYGMNAAD